MFLLYNILVTLLSPIWAPWMFIRANRRAEKPNWKERSGEYALRYEKGTRRVWVHAVSVGEVIAALPLLRELRKRSDFEILLSVTTTSGHKTATDQAVNLFDYLVYFPIDVARFQLAAITRVRPSVVAIMETELWMNFLWAADVVGAKTLLVNGRISDRSFPRSRLISFFYRAMFRYLDFAYMQTEVDAERIRTLGASNVEVFGNMKYDQAMDSVQPDGRDWRSELGIPGGNKVLVIGSTRGEEEEDFVLHALLGLDLASASIIHAPRHLERVQALAKKAPGRVGLRSRGETGDYLILDTYGELSSVYSIADIVIIGGGFANFGGQNLIQPLAAGKPVLHGPHMQNFADVADAAKRVGATIVCASPDELGSAVRDLLADGAKRKAMGDAGASLVRQNLGASKRYAEAIFAALDRK